MLPCAQYLGRHIYMLPGVFQCSSPEEEPAEVVSIAEVNRRASHRAVTGRWRLAALTALLVLLLASDAHAQRYNQATAHITTQTTTTVASAVAGFPITIWSALLCVDNGGAAIAFAIQDSAGTNLFGSGVVWNLGTNTCFSLPLRDVPYGIPTGLGKDLQIVTTVGNGPLEVYMEVLKR